MWTGYCNLPHHRASLPVLSTPSSSCVVWRPWVRVRPSLEILDVPRLAPPLVSVVPPYPLYCTPRHHRPVTSHRPTATPDTLGRAFPFPSSAVRDTVLCCSHNSSISISTDDRREESLFFFQQPLNTLVNPNRIIPFYRLLLLRLLSRFTLIAIF